MDFKYRNWRQRMSQDFDREKITIKKAGIEYNVYDKIQEAREDTEIYPTLEKYGCLDRLQLDAEKMYGDFTAFKDLRTMKDQQIKAEEMFYQLPLEVRQHFNNDMSLFMKDGEKWLKNKIESEKPKEETPKQETLNFGENNNDK